MSRYVDGFVVPVPKAKLREYKKLSKFSADVWLKHGALDYVEYIADDVPNGVHTSFPKAVKLKPTEEVIFTYITYKDRDHRDAVNAAVMEDPEFASLGDMNMPFDGKRFIWGGFRTFHDGVADQK